MKIPEKHSLSVIIILYFVANIFMLLNNGWFWDDWCLSTAEGLSEMLNQNGSSHIIPFMNFLLKHPEYSALHVHILNALIGIITIVLFFNLLPYFNLKGWPRFTLTLLFSLMPYNSAKVTIICFWYAVGLMVFLFAAYFFVLFHHRKSPFFRILSLILFFCSFLLLPSTLVLELSFILFTVIFYLDIKIKFNFAYLKSLFNKLLGLIDFLVIPFVFWFLRNAFLLPTGVYSSGYRQVSLSSILFAPLNLISSFIRNFIGLGTSADQINISIAYIFLFCLFFAILITFFLLAGKYLINQNTDKVLFTGIYFFIFGSLAYTLTGLVPSFDGYDSRHQILLVFGSTIILFYLIGLVQHAILQKIIIAMIISVFIISTISRQLQYQKSWFKQAALEKAFSKENRLTEGTNFIVIDNLNEYNEYDFNYAFYCYTGILNKVFGNQTRFAVDSKALIEIKNVKQETLINNSFYHMKDCSDIFNFRYTMFINPGKTLLSNFQSLKLLYFYYFDKRVFDEHIQDLVSIHLVDYKTWHY